MRTLPSAVVAILVLAAVSPAVADDTIAGTYEVKLEETGSTCDPKPETLSKGKLVITVKKDSVTVKIDAVYQMVGAAPKNGAISAKTTKLVGTSIGGLSARYSVAGHVDGGKVDLVLTAQYVRQDTNKPHCTQAWNVTGPRTGG